MTIEPKKIFIVPYRDRQRDKDIFIQAMKQLLADDPEPYEIYFAHQCDTRPFNRGATKNIGFLAIKAKYPEIYKTLTFIFHDVDTFPVKKGMLDYTTTAGVVKHYYGYRFALGGMFAIKGADFEKTLGFPNFWGWGMEDNAMQDRCLEVGLKIDRSVFYDIVDGKIARTFDGYTRIITKMDSYAYKNKLIDDFTALKNLRWNIVRNDPNDNNFFMIQISSFECASNPNDQDYKSIDLRKVKKLPVAKLRITRRDWKMFTR